ELGGKTWTEQRSLVRLAPDNRTARWTEGRGVLFGYWSYHGGHYTPHADRHVELMTRAGARTGPKKAGGAMEQNPWVKQHWSRVQAGAWEVRPQPWAREDPYDPAKYAAYQNEVVAAFTKARNAVPEKLRPDHVYFFPEPHISRRLTDGNIPSYWGEEA